MIFLMKIKNLLFIFIKKIIRLPIDFFDEDKKFIICSTHGALYSPKSGLCVAGPCKGQSLIKLNVSERNEDIVIFIDEEGCIEDG